VVVSDAPATERVTVPADGFRFYHLDSPALLTFGPPTLREAIGSTMDRFRVVDLFAGPGGLGEGFASFQDPASGDRPFRIVRSVEMDEHARATLRLRAFRHAFGPAGPPPQYYSYLRGEAPRQSLWRSHSEQAATAETQALHAELGKDDETILRSLDQALEGAGSDRVVVIGGPPCQAYSVIGRARRASEDRATFEADPRHRLYKHYLRILARYRPAAFVMENVKGLLSAQLEDQPIFERILTDLHDPAAAVGGPSTGRRRYDIWPLARPCTVVGASAPADFVIHCERFGVPQMRHRVIILGVRQDIETRPECLRSEDPLNVMDAIGDLPALRSGVSARGGDHADWAHTIRSALPVLIAAAPELKDVVDEACRRLGKDLPRRWVPARTRSADRLAAWVRSAPEPVICNHEARTHMEEDLVRYFFAACYAAHHRSSPKLRHFPPSLLPNHKSARVERPGFDDRFRVQLWDRPASTITSHIAKDGHYYIHPDPTQCRSLTVREAARLQTFPDDYFFEGPRTEQYKQVGNAVPPLLARQIAGIVYDVLKRRNGP